MVLVKYRKRPNYNPRTSFVHFILCTSSTWAIRQTTYSDTPLMFTTFGFLLGHSILGTINYGHPDASDNIQKVYDQSALIADTLPIAFTTAQLYQLLGPEKLLPHPFYNNLHLISVVVPLATQFFFSDSIDTIVDVIVFGNLCSLTHLAARQDSAWIWGLAVLTGLNHFVFRRFSSDYEVPKADVVAVGLSFFCIFAVNCICDCK